MNLRVILFGATGMVGEGVLHECLNHQDVETVLAVGRRSCNLKHPKLTELLHGDFYDFSPLRDRLTGYNACFFCLGVSSVGMEKEEYRHMTYDLTMGVAHMLCALNPDMTFCYVSGAGTDSTEQGRLAWARVKGKVENELLRLPFKAAYMIRPAYIQPTRGLTRTLAPYKLTAPLYPLLRALFPRHVATLQEVGIAMIQAAARGYRKNVLESVDIVELASLNRTS